MVMGDDSFYEGHEFESQHHILDGLLKNLKRLIDPGRGYYAVVKRPLCKFLWFESCHRFINNKNMFLPILLHWKCLIQSKGTLD